jgi:hypothetical protein
MKKFNTLNASVFEGSDENSWQAASRADKDFVTGFYKRHSLFNTDRFGGHSNAFQVL